jgi:hypothetical protein
LSNLVRQSELRLIGLIASVPPADECPDFANTGGVACVALRNTGALILSLRFPGFRAPAYQNERARRILAKPVPSDAAGRARTCRRRAGEKPGASPALRTGAVSTAVPGKRSAPRRRNVRRAVTASLICRPGARVQNGDTGGLVASDPDRPNLAPERTCGRYETGLCKRRSATFPRETHRKVRVRQALTGNVLGNPDPGQPCGLRNTPPAGAAGGWRALRTRT